MRSGEKRALGEKLRDCATVRMKMYKYVSWRDGWESRGGGETALAGGKRNKGRRAAAGGNGLTEVDSTVQCGFCHVLRDPVACVCLCACPCGISCLSFCIMAAHIPRQQ